MGWKSILTFNRRVATGTGITGKLVSAKYPKLKNSRKLVSAIYAKASLAKISYRENWYPRKVMTIRYSRLQKTLSWVNLRNMSMFGNWKRFHNLNGCQGPEVAELRWYNLLTLLIAGYLKPVLSRGGGRAFRPPYFFLRRNFEQVYLKINHIRYPWNKFACQFVSGLDNLLARYRLKQMLWFSQNLYILYWKL